MRHGSYAILGAALLVACAETSQIPKGADVGPDPMLVQPVKSLLPTIQVAEAVGWNEGGKPIVAPGLKVVPYAKGLDHPRWVIVLPNGDALVAESNAPERPEEGKGLKAFFMKMFMKKAGAGVKSADRITLLRDADGDGVAEVKIPLIENLHSPFGMAYVDGALYVANTDAVVRFPFKAGELKAGQGQRIAELPAGPRNHHWTKCLIASRDGKKLYATVGSNSNIAEHGMAEEEGRAAIWEIDTATGAKRLFATGLRNPNGMGWEPGSGKLFTVVNERDELGSDLVPDYITSVNDGAFYGWPYSYYGQHVDERPQPPRPDLVAKATKPDYALGSHVAALGLAFSEGLQWPTPFATGAFVGEHGSWNRKPPNGYNVVFVPFAGGKPTGKPVEVLTGFITADGKALGRPVGVAVDKRNGLLVADDVGNTIWRVSPSSG